MVLGAGASGLRAGARAKNDGRERLYVCTYDTGEIGDWKSGASLESDETAGEGCDDDDGVRKKEPIILRLDGNW